MLFDRFIAATGAHLMDVVLDSNAYLSDIRMESIRFKNLFDYLRRTESSLVIPRLVREETVGKFRSLLDEQSRKTASAIKQLNRLVVDKNHEIHFHAPDLRYAVRDLRAKFRAPADGVSVRYYPETSGVDVSEVFLRGVKRRRPASSAGEELRDVIIWLIVLQFAEAEKKPVALVTSDGGFWNDTQVHDHLLEDIRNRKVNVSVFRTIEDFMKASAPPPVPVDAEYVSKFFDVLNMQLDLLGAAKKVLANWKRTFWQPFTVRSVQLTRYKFTAGTAYEINPETKFIELVYDLTFTAHVALTEWPEPTGKGFSSILGTSLGNPFDAPSGRLSEMVSPSNLNRFLTSYTSFLGTPEPAPQAERITVKAYAVSATAQVSIRLLNEALSETELDRLEIYKVEEMKEAEPAEPAQPPVGEKK
jgi:hypothetical protein